MELTFKAEPCFLVCYRVIPYQISPGVYILENTPPPWGGGKNIGRCHLGEKI